MKLSEVAILIGYISGTDNRNTDNPYTVQAWHDSLEPWVSLEDAKAAVINHRRTSSDYLEVGHVNAYVKTLRRARIQANQIVPVIPMDLHQAQERAWTLSFWDAVKCGAPDPHAAADSAMSITRSDDPLVLRASFSAEVRALAASKAIPAMEGNSK